MYAGKKVKIESVEHLDYVISKTGLKLSKTQSEIDEMYENLRSEENFHIEFRSDFDIDKTEWCYDYGKLYDDTRAVPTIIINKKDIAMKKITATKYTIRAKLENLNIKRITEENANLDFIEIDLAGYTLDGENTLLIAKYEVIEEMGNILGVLPSSGSLLYSHLGLLKGKLTGKGECFGHYTNAPQWKIITSHNLAELVSLREKTKKLKEKEFKFEVTAL